MLQALGLLLVLNDGHLQGLCCILQFLLVLQEVLLQSVSLVFQLLDLPIELVQFLIRRPN